MRPDYRDQERNATVWAAALTPPRPNDDVSRVLRRSFAVPEPVDEEWDRLLARIV
jgi:hypothetical protein